METSPYYCTSCGYSWTVTLDSLLARVTGRAAVSTTPRCPRCAAMPFFEGECAWCGALFLHQWGESERCPTCEHDPYWDD